VEIDARLGSADTGSGCRGVGLPGISIQVASILLGAYLLISGIAQMVSAFVFHEFAGTRVLLFISGALSLVLGVLAFRYLDLSYPIPLLAIWIGVAFIFQGIAEVAVSISSLPDRGWQTFLGVISVIAGIVVLVWPFDSIYVLAIVTGVWLVIIGIAQILWALRARGALNTGEREVERLSDTVS
jgi:uncharacterized membrane protein HdeD (DUF308 family)